MFLLDLMLTRLASTFYLRRSAEAIHPGSAPWMTYSSITVSDCFSFSVLLMRELLNDKKFIKTIIKLFETFARGHFFGFRFNQIKSGVAGENRIVGVLISCGP